MGSALKKKQFLLHMKNASYIKEIKELIEKYPKHYIQLLHSEEKRYLLDYIVEETNDLLISDFFTLPTRTYFCINDLHEFPTCPSCNRIIDDKNVANVKLGYNRYCSRSCINKDPNVRKKIEATNFKRLGVVNALCLESSREKNRQVKAANKKPPQKHIRKSKEEISLNHKIGYQKYIKTVKEKYGVENISQLQSIKDKKRTTFNQHKLENPHFIENAKKQQRTTMLKKHGVENPSQSYEIHRKQTSKYKYEEQKFDSAAEIAFYIWLKENKISFEYSPNIELFYEFNGKIHRYFPDFIVNGKLIELKGDHFFKEDDTMKCPFKRKEWSENLRNEIDAKYEAKHQCMLKNDVLIIRYSEMEKYFNYIYEKYGKNYLKQFKIFN